MEENKELREQLANDLEKMQQQGFLAQKSEAQIRDALQEANLPATKEFVDKVAGTLQMSMSINEMTDAAKVYVIQKWNPADDRSGISRNAFRQYGS